jgi:ProQ/FINO family
LPGYFQKLRQRVIDANLDLPEPVKRYFGGRPTPLATNTRKQLPAWCKAHGYTEDQRGLLNSFVKFLVQREAYHRAVAAGVVRMNLDGNETGPPTADHRAYAEERLAALQQQQRPKPRPDDA